MPFYDGKVYLITVVAIEAPEGMTLEEINNGGYVNLPCELSRTEIVSWPGINALSEVRDCAIDASHKLDALLNKTA